MWSPGSAGSGQPTRFIPMVNAARSPTFYEFDSMDLLRLYREMDAADEEPVVIYHSHTATEAYPSRTDVSYASEPEAHYVVVSTRDPETIEFRSFRIVDEAITEEEVECGSDVRSDTDLYREGALSPWPSRSVSPRSCVTTPAVPRRLTPLGPRWTRCSATWMLSSLAYASGWSTNPGLRRFVNVYLNDEDVRFLDGLATPVGEGDQVTILPAVAGGATDVDG